MSFPTGRRRPWASTLRSFETELGTRFSQDDVIAMADAVEPGCPAGVLVWEKQRGPPTQPSVDGWVGATYMGRHRLVLAPACRLER
jgi:hypothetical protein